MSYISEIQDTISRVPNYFWKDLLQKKVCDAEIDEKLTALFIGLRWVQNCETRSRNMEGREFSDTDRPQTLLSRKQQDGEPVLHEFQTFLCCIFVPSRTHCGNLMALELMGHVAIPYM